LQYVSYLTWDRRLNMLRDVAAGLMYLHKSQYAHGDLRTDNLFVASDGRVCGVLNLCQPE
jgi:tRNA A-37 threonylcarbamoyl transferase component Bud32